MAIWCIGEMLTNPVFMRVRGLFCGGQLEYWVKISLLYIILCPVTERQLVPEWGCFRADAIKTQ